MGTGSSYTTSCCTTTGTGNGNGAEKKNPKCGSAFAGAVVISSVPIATARADNAPAKVREFGVAIRRYISWFSFESRPVETGSLTWASDATPPVVFAAGLKAAHANRFVLRDRPSVTRVL